MSRAAAPSTPATPWTARFLRRVLLWLLPAWAFWALLTPGYNLFLLRSGQNLLHLTEYPSVTFLVQAGPHDARIVRTDIGNLERGFRVTDLHFHLILLLALFLAVPEVTWRKRLENLGWAILITIFFDIFLVFSTVKFTYATQLGPWSQNHYGPWARNAWGLLHHLLDLPFKLALPLVLWAAFYLSLLNRGARFGARGTTQNI